MKKYILIFGLFLIVISATAQKKSAKVEFEVAGVCNMCKERIEKAALTTKGVKYANWNVQTHMLSLIVDERKTTTKKVQQNIAAVGHSTKEVEAPIEAYNNLDPCCKYNDEEVVKNHNNNE